MVKHWIISILFAILRCTKAKFFLLRWLTKGTLLVLFGILKEHGYALIFSTTRNKKRSASRIPFRASQIKLQFFAVRVLVGDKKTSLERYSSILSKAQSSSPIKHQLMHHFLNAGRLDLAKATALDLIEGKQDEFLSENRLQILRYAGIFCFMLGQNKEANDYWRLAGEHRKALFKPSTPLKYRIIGSSWYAAVGHVAMLDYYLKYKKLYGQDDHRIVVTLNGNKTLPPNLGCASDLMRKFSEMGITILGEDELETDYDHWAKDNNAPKWQHLSSLEKQALIDDFWEYEFPDGAILSFTHAAARIQKDWEQAKRPPLLTITPTEKTWVDDFRLKLGIPREAWFVCLHVREAGFHKQWNALLPAMRDSEIVDYYPSIQEIVDAGGWVLRMGDPSMKPIPSMHHVIDYAHSIHRTPFADMLLAASCRFFLGTNSGFATIPAIYGVPCALSNWVPIGWPLWPSQDLMICKLFREKATQRFLSLEEIFERGLAFLQNCSDLPDDIELIANTPEDIRRLTLEMLSCFYPEKRSIMEVGAPATLLDHYTKIANRFETFTSSRFAGSFVKNYPDVFAFSEPEEIKNSDEKQPQLQEQMV